MRITDWAATSMCMRAGVPWEPDSDRVQHGVFAIPSRLADQKYLDEDERRRQKWDAFRKFYNVCRVFLRNILGKAPALFWRLPNTRFRLTTVFKVNQNPRSGRPVCPVSRDQNVPHSVYGSVSPCLHRTSPLVLTCLHLLQRLSRAASYLRSARQNAKITSIYRFLGDHL